MRYRIGRPFLTAVLAAYAMYCARAAYAVYGLRRDLVWAYTATAVLALGAIAGLMMNRPWSRYIVYLLGISYSTFWMYYIVQYARAGGYSGATPLQIGGSLSLGAVTVAVALLSVWLARRQFITSDQHDAVREGSCLRAAHESESRSPSTPNRWKTLVAGGLFVLLSFVYVIVGYRERSLFWGMARVMVGAVMSLTVSGLVIGVFSLVPAMRRELKGAWVAAWFWVAAIVTMIAIVGAKTRH